jgi:hypothetical protein
MTVPDHRFNRAAVPSLLAVAFLLAACSAGGASRASAIASPSTGPEPSIAVAPTVFPSSEPSLSIEPPSPEPPMAEPPAAAIGVEGGDPVFGELGSFTWQNSGSDSPWLPGYPIRIGASETLMVTLAEPFAIANWQASYVPSSDLHSTTPVGLSEGTGEPITFEAPPVGEWSVSVDVWFAGGIGSAAYYWLVEVD